MFKMSLIGLKAACLALHLGIAATTYAVAEDFQKPPAKEDTASIFQEALDPQTLQQISDHELELLAARFRDNPEFVASMNTLAVAEILENVGERQRAGWALEKALQLCPKNPDAWLAVGGYLERSGAPEMKRITLHEQAATQFANQPDLRRKSPGGGKTLLQTNPLPERNGRRQLLLRCCRAIH